MPARRRFMLGAAACATALPSLTACSAADERFHIAETAITITPDFTRRCPAVDPDDHHLFVSLGLRPEERPDLVVRFGRGPGLSLSMRRPLLAVLA